MPTPEALPPLQFSELSLDDLKLIFDCFQCMDTRPHIGMINGLRGLNGRKADPDLQEEIFALFRHFTTTTTHKPKRDPREILKLLAQHRTAPQSAAEARTDQGLDARQENVTKAIGLDTQHASGARPRVNTGLATTTTDPTLSADVAVEGPAPRKRAIISTESKDAAEGFQLSHEDALRAIAALSQQVAGLQRQIAEMKR